MSRTPPGSAHGLTAENALGAFPLALNQDSRVLAQAEVTAEELHRRLGEIDMVRLYAMIDRMDEPLLDMLAYDFKVDWWNPEYSPEEKRRTLKSSWYVHKHLGTKSAVETGLRAIYPNSWAQPWFEYEDGDGRPYHFRLHIDLSNEMLAEGKPARVLERVRYYQSLRDHIDEFRYTIEAKEPAMLYAGGSAGASDTLGSRNKPDVFDFRDGLHVGGGAGVSDTLGSQNRPDVFDFRGTLPVGGKGGTLDILPQPECLKQPEAVSILRTGGVCTIISGMGGAQQTGP